MYAVGDGLMWQGTCIVNRSHAAMHPRLSRQRTHKKGHMPQRHKRLGARLVERSVAVRTLSRAW